MVDEFQDTNALQCEVIDLLGGGPGEGGVLRRRRVPVDLRVPARGRRRLPRAAGARPQQRFSLTENYRSRPEVLAAVNHVFGEEFGDGYQPLAASGEFPDPVFGHPVELLVTDKESYRESGEHWRRAEARAIARRVRELVDAGAATPGEIVLLFAAGTDAELYEEELRALGLPTYRATGRRYFGQQQVVDLLMYLRLLRNRYDDEALTAVLASPFVGVSNDGARADPPARRAGGRSSPGSSARCPAHSPSATSASCARSSSATSGSSPLSARASLERLCELVISGHDYDLAVLARWDGRRRYANLRKLMRLARTYEEVRGRDLEGFVGFLRDQEALGAAQLEAVSEEEGADAVRLLTIHAAKGLEFKVVVVADAGRDLGGPPPADEILALSDGRFGFKVVHPTSGERKAVFGYDEVLGAEREAGRAERLRLYYVAMTRAVDRLLVSGARRRERATRRSAGCCRSSIARRSSAARPPCSSSSAAAPRSSSASTARASRSPSWRRPRPGKGSWRCSTSCRRRRRPAAGSCPSSCRCRSPPLHHVRQLSYSALALFQRCSYRYYAERVAGLRERRAAPVRGRRARGDRDRRRRAPAARGRRPGESGDARPRRRSRVVPGRERRGARADRRVRPVVLRVPARAASREPRRRPARAAVRVRPRRRPAPRTARRALPPRGPRRSSSTTRRTSSASAPPEEVVESEYRLQRLVYALACFRAGDDEVEIVYSFLERPDGVVSATFTRADLPGARGRALGGDREGRGRRVHADAERVHLRRLPGARRRLRRPEAARRACRRPCHRAGRPRRRLAAQWAA